MKKIIFAVLASTLILSTPTYAAAAPAKANICMGCHGQGGHSVIPNYPVLAGQHAAYITKALKDFRDGFRDNTTMKAFAKNLSDKDITELANYFSAQK